VNTDGSGHKRGNQVAGYSRGGETTGRGGNLRTTNTIGFTAVDPHHKATWRNQTRQGFERGHEAPYGCGMGSKKKSIHQKAGKKEVREKKRQRAIKRQKRSGGECLAKKKNILLGGAGESVGAAEKRDRVRELAQNPQAHKKVPEEPAPDVWGEKASNPWE